MPELTVLRNDITIQERMLINDEGRSQNDRMSASNSDGNGESVWARTTAFAG